MNYQPLVTITTPSLNQGKFIRATIDSILNQTYENLEYWVIDGGSTDDTLDILRSYGDRIHWISEEDRGQSHAINKGWQRAHGEILGWVNADDMLTNVAVEKAVECLVKSPGVGAVYGNALYIDLNDNPLKLFPTQAFDYEKLVVETEDYIPQTSVFIRREVIEKVGWLNEELHYVMDYDYWLRLGCYTPMQYIPVQMAFLRLHAGAKTIQAMQLFAREFSWVFENLFSSLELEETLKRQEQEVLHMAYIHSASFCFWGGHTAQAIIYLKKALQKKMIPSKRSFWFLLLFSTLGKFGWKLAETLHGNPMRFGKGLFR